ncbi:MAG TPA: CHAT domain-containing tetratricopeptide repeat protein [Anaerolineales bacterium]|nr:CHAT domain-containing tetratricopeptide repeat protein [Anaerolineales bacterium]
MKGLSEGEIEQFADALKNKVTDLILEDTERAIELADCILIFPEITESERHQALGLRMKGLAMVQGKGDFQGALSLYQEAVSIHQTYNDRFGEALVYLNEIWALANVGRYDEAIQKGEWAKTTFEELNERFLLAKVCNNLALVYQRRGEFRVSLDLLEQAITLYQEIGKDAESLLPTAENNLGLSLCYIGNYREAVQAGEKAVQWSEALNQPIAVARAKHNLGMILTVQGHFTRALTLFEEARVVHQEHGQPHEAALCKLSALVCLGILRRFDEVIQINEEIQSVFRQLEMHHEEGHAILFYANALIELGKFAEAISAYQAARRIYEEEENYPLMGRCDLGKARLYLRMGEFSTCLDLAEKCAVEFSETGLLIYYALASMIVAQAAMESGNYRECERALNRVSEMLEKNKWAELFYQFLQIKGDFSWSQNRFDEALDYFEQAIDAFEQLRGNIMVEFRSGFIEDKQTVYGKMVDLCLESELLEKGFRFAERAKSRALVELLAHRPDLSIRARDAKDAGLVEELMALREQRETRLRYGINLVSANGKETQEQVLQVQQEVQTIEKKITALWHQLLIRNADYARDASLWGVQAETLIPLFSDSILVEFFSVKKQWVVFLVSSAGGKDSIRAIRLQITTREIENLLQRFRVNLGFVARSSQPQFENLNHNAQGVLHQLYKALFAPIVPLVADYSNLIIVPHGPLHYLPFHALYDGKQYLVEKFQISCLPAASLLSNQAVSQTESKEAMVIGHSFNGRLPNAVEEAKKVAQLWNVKAICEEDASSQLFLSHAENASLIHLACHGEFRADNPLFSGLALENGWLTTLDVFNLHLQTSLITLSACQTGESVVSGGDELFGLMRAFLSAGAASLLLSHWPVSDQSTALLMQNFYQKLKDGASKGAALRAVQMQFLATEDKSLKKYRHPYFWAPFFLVGQDGYL